MLADLQVLQNTEGLKTSQFLQGSHEMAAELCIILLQGSCNPSRWPLVNGTALAAAQAAYMLVCQSPEDGMQSGVPQEACTYGHACCMLANRYIHDPSCCLQALNLLQAGSVRPAERLLHLLGCTHRLSDAVLLHRSSTLLHSGVHAQPCNGPAVLSDALSGEATVVC